MNDDKGSCRYPPVIKKDERDELKAELEQLKKEAKQRESQLLKAKEFYGPAGFKHVSAIMDERDMIKVELEQLRNEKFDGHYHDSLRADYDKLKLLVESLRSSLVKYGRHFLHCDYPCTCGLRAALKEGDGE